MPSSHGPDRCPNCGHGLIEGWADRECPECGYWEEQSSNSPSHGPERCPTCGADDPAELFDQIDRGRAFDAGISGCPDPWHNTPAPDDPEGGWQPPDWTLTGRGYGPDDARPVLAGPDLPRDAVVALIAVPTARRCPNCNIGDSGCQTCRDFRYLIPYLIPAPTPSRSGEVVVPEKAENELQVAHDNVSSLSALKEKAERERDELYKQRLAVWRDERDQRHRAVQAEQKVAQLEGVLRRVANEGDDEFVQEIARAALSPTEEEA